MSNDLISFELKSSWMALWLTIIMLASLIIGLSYSQIQLIYKLLLLCSMFGFVIFHAQTYFQNKIDKCDLLIHLNTAIFWQNKQSKLVNLTTMKAIGNYLIILQFTEKNKTQRLLIFPDSTTKTTYKELIRQIRWQKLKQN